MNNRKLTKIFIANRGEIAYRIIRTASRLGISTVLPVVPEEKDTLPARAADEIHVLENSILDETYLNGKVMIELALKYGADAIHPGYGFLSENAEFARLAENAGLIWIGPPPDAMALMGNKLSARKVAQKAGIPVPKGISGTKQEILKNHDSLRFPLLIKATAGGGGKGMKIAHNSEQLETMLDDAAREAKNYFGDQTIYVEEYIDNPRHIEVQIFGDQYGNVVHLFERECSIQRRFQKIVEESPSAFVDDNLRDKLSSQAVKLAQQINYCNAGTVEFLVDSNKQHYFLEMNTRLQVEHPVTEAITGIDLVEEQIKTAMGLPLSFIQEDVKAHGHAIEARIYAEDALNNFRPSPGKINFVKWPSPQMARTDSFFDSSVEIPSFFDPLLAKITVWGFNRKEAIEKLSLSLEQTSVIGITTGLPWLRKLTKTEAFVTGNTTTHFTTTYQDLLHKAIQPNGLKKNELLLAAFAVWIIHYRNENNDNNIWNKLGHKRWGNNFEVTLAHKTYTVKIKDGVYPHSLKWCLDNNIMDDIHNITFSSHNLRFYFREQWAQLTWYYTHRNELLLEVDGHTYRLFPGFRLNNITNSNQKNTEKSNIIKAPIPGKISKILVKKGELVNESSPLMILEAMKMENTLQAKARGMVKEVRISEGEQVKAGQILAEIDDKT